MQFLKGFRQNKCNVESNLYVISHAFTGCTYATIVDWCSPGNGTLLAMWRQFTKQRCRTDAAVLSLHTVPSSINTLDYPKCDPYFVCG